MSYMQWMMLWFAVFAVLTTALRIRQRNEILRLHSLLAELQGENERLRDTITMQKARIAELEADNKRLRDEMDSWTDGMAKESGE